MIHLDPIYTSAFVLNPHSNTIKTQYKIEWKFPSLLFTYWLPLLQCQQSSKQWTSERLDIVVPEWLRLQFARILKNSNDELLNNHELTISWNDIFNSEIASNNFQYYLLYLLVNVVNMLEIYICFLLWTYHHF